MVESGDILSMSRIDDKGLSQDVEEDEIEDGDEGHKICSKADVPMIGRSSDPDDALSSGGEYRKRSTSNDVTGAGIKASMLDVDNLEIEMNELICLFI